MPRLLDLFCCEGGAGAGYARAGFTVVGVDLEPQPRYPYPFIQADAMELLGDAAFLAEFDAYHASPPCQDHSVSRHAVGGDHGTGWMLSAVIEAFRPLGKPWVVENVGAAVMPSAMTLCGTTFGLGLHRHRRFETSWLVLAEGCRGGAAVRYRGRAAEVFGHHGNTDRVREEWQVPWMSQYGTAQCVPPAFTEFLGSQMLELIGESSDPGGP